MKIKTGIKAGGPNETSGKGDCDRIRDPEVCGC